MNPVSLAAAAESGLAESRERREIRGAAEAFEAMFLQTLIKKMREAQLSQGLFGDSAGSSVYESMFDQMLGDRMAEGSPLGIADSLEASWTQMPENKAKALDLMREVAETAAKVRGASADE